MRERTEEIKAAIYRTIKRLRGSPLSEDVLKCSIESIVDSNPQMSDVEMVDHLNKVGIHKIGL